MRTRALSMATALAFAIVLPVVTGPAHADSAATSPTAADHSINAAADPAPEPLTEPSITGATRVGQTLTAVGATWPVSGDSSFAWSVAGASVGTGGATYVVKPEDLGKSVRLTETFVSPDHEVATATADSTVITRGSAPVATAATAITGTAQVGQALTAEAATWPLAGTSSFVWSVAGTPVGTGKTYVVRPADLDQAITVTETFTSPGYDNATATPVESAKVLPGTAPTATLPSWVIGAARVGSTLEITPATWPLPGTSTFVWSVDGTTVGTGSSITVGPELIGKRLTVSETFKSPGYSPGTATAQPGTVGKAAVTLSVAARKAKKGKVSATIAAASGQLMVTGQVTVTYAGKKVRSLTLKNGKVTAKLPRKPKGTYWLTVAYAGTSVFAKAGKTIAAKVR